MKKLYNLAPTIVPFALLWVIDTLWVRMSLGSYFATTTVLVLACVWNCTTGIKTGLEIVRSALDIAAKKYLADLDAEIQRMEKEEKVNDTTQ